MSDADNSATKQGQCFRCGMFSLFIGAIPFVGYRLWVRFSQPALICSECFERVRLRNGHQSEK